MELSLKSTRLLGPFWLLVAAWFCANLPQSAYVDLLQRFEGMRHFSHQAQLAADTLNVLQGGGREVAVKSDRAPAPAKPCGQPASSAGESLLKKFEFATSVQDEVPRPIELRGHFFDFEFERPEALYRDVPYPPPRDGGIG